MLVFIIASVAFLLLLLIACDVESSVQDLTSLVLAATVWVSSPGVNLRETRPQMVIPSRMKDHPRGLDIRYRQS
jgi:hypothetical protein